MKAEYRRDLQNNYLILEAAQAEEDDYRLKMAEQNPIPGLLLFHSARKNGILYLHYEITSKQPLVSVFEQRTMGYEDIFSLLAGIRDILEAMQKYLLEPAQLIFDPEYIYVDPNRHKVQLCYLPGSKENRPIYLLAEFILKKLNHKEQQAVTLGYEFYQRAGEENFSLQNTLKEILATKESQSGDPGGRAVHTDDFFLYREDQRRDESPAADERGNSDRDPVDHGECGRQRYADRLIQESVQNGNRGCISEKCETFNVTHRERKRRPRDKVDRLFQIIHPAVLLSSLFLLALLEIAFYLKTLTITEAGGIFFLLISVEALVNKFWRTSKEKKNGSRWITEEDDEAYRILQEEMYEAPGKEPMIEETRCLTPEPEQTGICLVCTHAGASGIAGPDIPVGTTPVYIGKIQGESDIILDSPTVSRRHARLECCNGVCYVKDLNSRNGTFCNGRRLRPQEQCQFGQGDELSFAEIGYRAVLSQPHG